MTNEKKRNFLVLITSITIIVLVIFFGWKSPNQSSLYPPITSTSTANTSTTSSTSVQPSSTVSTTITTPPLAANNGHAIGIAGGGDLSKISTSTLNKELDQMVALGITWVRFDIEWGDVQYSSSSSFTWSSYDNLINALAAHHLHGLGVILFTPPWNRNPSCGGGVECPPADISAFATFAAEVAARYKSDGMHDWEIWNEPNNYNFWAIKTDCNAYTALLKVTYPAIKKVDPNAVVVTGGLAPETTDAHNTSPTDFLSCIYKAGGEPYFDAVGDHPYTYPLSPANDGAGAWNQMISTTPSLRSIMIANGDSNKKIWITEFGTPTDGPDPQWYVSEAQQSQMVIDTMQLYKSYTWAGPLFWYTFKDNGTSTSTNENFFGLVRADGSTKPAYTTLQNIISAGL
jgi:hypothetical protein